MVGVTIGFSSRPANFAGLHIESWLEVVSLSCNVCTIRLDYYGQLWYADFLVSLFESSWSIVVCIFLGITKKDIRLTAIP